MVPEIIREYLKIVPVPLYFEESHGVRRSIENSEDGTSGYEDQVGPGSTFTYTNGFRSQLIADHTLTLSQTKLETVTGILCQPGPPYCITCKNRAWLVHAAEGRDVTPLSIS